MPAMSPSMTEGTIARWNKQEGDEFVQGDVLVQIVSFVFLCAVATFLTSDNHHQQLDLATFDVEAHSSGTLGKILVRCI